VPPLTTTRKDPRLGYEHKHTIHTQNGRARRYPEASMRGGGFCILRAVGLRTGIFEAIGLRHVGLRAGICLE